MKFPLNPRSPRRLGAVLFAAGLVAGMASIGFSSRIHAAAAMSPLDKLIAEDEISQVFTDYVLYVDGDGVKPRDLRAVGDKSFTPDDVFENYTWDGKLGNSVAGRDVFYQFALKTAFPEGQPIAIRHYVLPTYFDEITPTTAKTRTTSFAIKITKNMLGADCKKAGEDACGGRVLEVLTFTYHNEWKKTAEGWRMSRIVIYSDV